MTWLDKYKPLLLKDVVGNKTVINEILKWIDDLKNHRTNKQVMILNGNSGVGKSLIANLVLLESGYRVNMLNLNNIIELNKLYEKLEVIITSKNIYTMIYKHNPISLILDDIENIHMNTSKNFILEFTHILKNFKTDVPIICTSKIYSEKKTQNLSKVCNIIQMKSLNKKKLVKYAKKISKREGLRIMDECYPIIIDHSDYDTRRLIIILENIYTIYKDTLISLDNLDILLNSLQKKDIDSPLFDLTELILNTKITESDASIYYNLDKYMLPYMMHENYINVIMRKNNSIDDRLRSVIRCSDSLSSGVIFQNYANKTFNWDIDEYNSMLSCKYLNYHIMKLKKSSITNMYHINYTTLFNKISLNSVNYKYFIEIKKLTSLSLDEVYYLSVLLYYYIYTVNNYKKVSKIL
jgi:DNA polymerase III delta prime subunit